MNGSKVALITGASRGLGRAIAVTLAERGFDIVVNYQAKSEEAEKTAAKIHDLGRKAITLKADAKVFSQVEEMVQTTVKEFGRIDVAVANAGIHRDGTVVKIEMDDWYEVIHTNLYGAFHLARCVVPVMIEQKYGRFICTSSVVSETGNFGVSNYAASKAGLHGFIKSLAKETARKGITVNGVAPGFFDIGMMNDIPENIRKMVIAQIPMNRLGRPEELAKAAAFLASDDASYITGQIIHVNGGFYM